MMVRIDVRALTQYYWELRLLGQKLHNAIRPKLRRILQYVYSSSAHELIPMIRHFLGSTTHVSYVSLHAFRADEQQPAVDTTMLV
jgi:hypothetical protein